LNLGPRRYQRRALPTELWALKLITGYENAASAASASPIPGHRSGTV